MTYLVTGATGLIGNNVVRRLLERGREGASARTSGGATSDHCPDSTSSVFVGDIRNRAEVERAMADVAAVIHSAAFVHIGRRRPFLGASRQRRGQP